MIHDRPLKMSFIDKWASHYAHHFYFTLVLMCTVALWVRSRKWGWMDGNDLMELGPGVHRLVIKKNVATVARGQNETANTKFYTNTTKRIAD